MCFLSDQLSNPLLPRARNLSLERLGCRPAISSAIAAFSARVTSGLVTDVSRIDLCMYPFRGSLRTRV